MMSRLLRDSKRKKVEMMTLMPMLILKMERSNQRRLSRQSFVVVFSTSRQEHSLLIQVMRMARRSQYSLGCLRNGIRSWLQINILPSRADWPTSTRASWRRRKSERARLRLLDKPWSRPLRSVKQWSLLLAQRRSKPPRVRKERMIQRMSKRKRRRRLPSHSRILRENWTSQIQLTSRMLLRSVHQGDLHSDQSSSMG